MKIAQKIQPWWGLIGLIILYIVSRFIWLGQVPAGMTSDEAAIGYNGFAIVTTRRDEWLDFLPLSFRSFGDYKAPLAIYLSGISTLFFGMNLWAVRLPFAIMGILGALSFAWLTYLLFQQHSQKHLIATLAFALFTFSPWQHHFVRIGFESGFSMHLLILGIALWVAGWNSSSTKIHDWRQYVFSKNWKERLRLLRHSSVILIMSVTVLCLTFYTYHSAKVTVPIIILVLIWQYRHILHKHWRLSTILFIQTTCLLLPLAYDAILGKGLTRMSSSVLGSELPILEKITLTLKHFIVHFSPEFLLFGGTTTLRHSDGEWGVLLITTLLLCLTGLVSFIFRKHRTLQPAHLFLTQVPLAITFIVAGTLPAAIGFEVPHPNRALLALPGFLLLALIGGIAGYTYLKKHSPLIAQSVVGLCVMTHVLFFTTYIYHYYTVFAPASTQDFAEGYLEAIEYVVAYEKGLDGRTPPDQIIISSAYGSPYIYVLFVRQTNPIWYQGGIHHKYLYLDRVTTSHLLQPNTIVVATQYDSLDPQFKPDYIVYGTDGTQRFRIYKTYE